MEKLFLGCDLGGTNIKVGLVNIETGEILAFKSRATKSNKGRKQVIQRIVDLMEEVIIAGGYQKADVSGAGIGLPGVLDLEKGEIVFLTNFPGKWRNYPIVSSMQEALGLPVHILNDVRLITLAEWKYGAGQGVENMACLAIGTGIGGGLVINNKLHLGIGGTAGELGHMIISMDGTQCGCGSRGCLETFASGPAIAAMGVKAVMQGLTTSIGEKVDYDLNLITTRVIAEAALEGDHVACEVYEKAGEYLGIGISNILTSVSPQKVVISGGVAAAGELLMKPIRETVMQRVFVVPADEVEIVTGTLGNNAGILGAASWASIQVSESNSVS
ncbi:MAG: ROK family protein [Anaerolineaceae bacterium]|nr:ROK family protein [Anaerolineaceae bacterium]